jgi:cell division protein FtsL
MKDKQDAKMRTGKSLVSAVIVILFLALLVTVFYLGQKKTNLEKEKKDLEAQVETLTTERDDLTKEKKDLEKKNKVLAKDAIARMVENNNMKFLLQEMQPYLFTVWDLSSREGNMCIELNPWIDKEKDHFYDFNVSLQEFAPYLTIDIPKDGETYEPGKFKITWSTSITVRIPEVKIWYSNDEGISWNAITGIIPNFGNYTWIPPNVSGKYILKICSRTGEFVATRKFEIRK